MKKIIERLNPHCGFYYDITKVLVRVRSAWQTIELAESPEFGKVLLLDGITQVALKGEERYHESLVIPAMLSHPDPQRVLVIGGGDGGVLREVLTFGTVRNAVMVELDEAVISFSKQYMPEISAGAFDDPRAEIVVGDGRAYVEQCPDTFFDVVIMDMTDPFGPSEKLYTREFFAQVKRILRGAEGVFAMHGESPIARPAAYACIEKTLRKVFSCVKSAFTYVPMYGTLWSFKFASGTTDCASLSAKDVGSLLNARCERMPKYCMPQTYKAIFAPEPAAIEALFHPEGRVIEDRRSHFPDAFDPQGA
jgi:spermidine synthase